MKKVYIIFLIKSDDGGDKMNITVNEIIIEFENKLN
ncbi:hypothetical protein AJ85_04750 [Alkalihalobacillus alcalophilus ATCC 27647 = CGMCC 1.3604]|uniref:Uncharacterized protein n=1 Tax=Alkalihalobacillus alcalophilus ATCC 27647 = CGMCC 1.3604 TaxID=1218173 RepID=A0A4S4K1H7_ALKAL|nr:hypothetical protein AJ85_04750 [Alkalihalobacillus alcalophilus ATCC 27647 = CGMCC 1.3604]